jgi:hypothetical protein
MLFFLFTNATRGFGCEAAKIVELAFFQLKRSVIEKSKKKVKNSQRSDTRVLLGRRPSKNRGASNML